MEGAGAIQAWVQSLSFPVQCLIVFGLMFFLDSIFALYTRRAAGGLWFQAGLFAGLIALSGSITVISYSTNNWLVLPLILGAMCGTMSVVWWDSRHERSPAEPDFTHMEILTLKEMVRLQWEKAIKG